MTVKIKSKRYKMKTNSSAKKRFKKTAGGKILHKPSGNRHNFTGKSKRKGKCSHSRQVSASHLKQINELIHT